MTADDYVLLASAVAGRRISIAASIRGDAAYTDGQAIFLPRAAGSMETIPPAAQAGLWLAVVAQAALIAAGSLDPRVLRQLVGRPDLARRYVYLEVVRASRVVADRLPVRFELQPEFGISPLSASAAESLEMARSRRPLPATPAYFGTLKPVSALRRALGEEGLSALTRPLQGQSQEVPSLDEEEAAEESAILRMFQNPFAAGGPLSTLLNDILGAGMSRAKASSDQNGGAEIPVGRIERSLRRGMRAVLAATRVQAPALDLAAANRALCYPEWDLYQKAYRRDWVFVEEVDTWCSDLAQDLRPVLEPPSRELRRQLESLGLDHEMHRAQNDGADLDLGALIDCAIDMRAGYSPSSANVYRASRRTRRDLAVVIVLDMSGSTGEANPHGDSVFNKQVTLAYQLGLSLQGCGDTLAMFGFHSWGRKLVRVVRLKGHEERWSGLIAERLRMLEPVGYTRTGAAIRHGARLLREEMRLPNRLLVLITDGIAYDQDYEHRYGECDTRKALEEAKSDGIACVALCVGSSTESGKLSEVFGAANILAVEEVRQIAHRVREVCRHALAAVARREVHRSAIRRANS